jgi:hypothetical protein
MHPNLESLHHKPPNKKRDLKENFNFLKVLEFIVIQKVLEFIVIQRVLECIVVQRVFKCIVIELILEFIADKYVTQTELLHPCRCFWTFMV